jgi:hypothetical protein
MPTEHDKAVKLSAKHPDLARHIEEIVFGGDLGDMLVKLKATVYDELVVLDDDLRTRLESKRDAIVRDLENADSLNTHLEGEREVLQELALLNRWLAAEGK